MPTMARMSRSRRGCGAGPRRPGSAERTHHEVDGPSVCSALAVRRMSRQVLLEGPIAATRVRRRRPPEASERHAPGASPALPRSEMAEQPDRQDSPGASRPAYGSLIEAAQCPRCAEGIDVSTPTIACRGCAQTLPSAWGNPDSPGRRSGPPRFMSPAVGSTGAGGRQDRPKDRGGAASGRRAAHHADAMRAP